MHLDQISTFVAVIESGSYNKASEKLFLSQPTITHRINKLESELGISLLVRGKKEVHLTKEGEVFLSYAREMLESFQESLKKIELLKSEKIINVGYGISLTNFMANRVIGSITSLTCETGYHLTALKDIEVITSLLENKIHIGITREYSENDHLEFRLITNEPIVVVAGEKLGISGGNLISFEEIMDENFIVPNNESLPNDFLEDFLICNHANIKYRTNDIQIQKKLVLDGHGISYFPIESIIDVLNNKNLIQLQIKDVLDITSPIYLVYRKDFYNQTLKNLFDLFSEHIYSN